MPGSSATVRLTRHAADCPATGYNVTRTMGVAMAKLSPSRGFAAELATALVILVASQ